VRRKKVLDEEPEEKQTATADCAPATHEILAEGRPFTMALAGDSDAIAARFLDVIPGAPDEMSVDYKPVAKIPRDVRARVAKAKKEWSLRFGRNGWGISRSAEVVTVRVPRRPGVEGVISLLADVPFEIASFASLHPWAEDNGDRYFAGSFGDLHCMHGWACAFRGRGHDRLVSRRWLDHGPWTLIRADGDLSFVLFHELDLDPAASLARARPAHRRMGISDEGGFIQSDYVFTQSLDGVVDQATGEYRIDAFGRDISQRLMRDASAAKTLGRLPNRVTFVFDNEERAYRNLPLLWLHEHGCLLVANGRERRLDAAYSAAGRHGG
jgi:hypothetical protein